MKAVCNRVNKEMKKVNLLEKNVIVPISINGITSNPETLHMTKSQQFRERVCLISVTVLKHFLCLWSKKELITSTSRS
jgi:hypothetical protein